MMTKKIFRGTASFHSSQHPSLEYNMRRTSVHLSCAFVGGISGARDNPRDSFPSFFSTSIRIGFGLELSIAKPVRSEVLKRNRITVSRDSFEFCFHCFKNSS